MIWRVAQRRQRRWLEQADRPSLDLSPSLSPSPSLPNQHKLASLPLDLIPQSTLFNPFMPLPPSDSSLSDNQQDHSSTSFFHRNPPPTHHDAFVHPLEPAPPADGRARVRTPKQQREPKIRLNGDTSRRLRDGEAEDFDEEDDEMDCRVDPRKVVQSS